MTLDLERAVRGGLALLVNDVSTAPEALADAVARRASAERRRRTSLLVGVGVAAAVAIAVATPVVVLQHTSAGPGPATSTRTLAVTDPTVFGEHLISEVELPPGGTPVDQAPARFLAQRLGWPSLIPEPTVVWRWWTYDAPPASIWLWLQRPTHQNPMLKLQTATGGDFLDTPPVNSLRSAGLTYSPRSALPFAFVYGDVTVVVGYLGPDRTGVAVYANVESRPAVPPAATVPVAGVRARVTWRDKTGVTQHRTVDGAAATRLATGLNYLPKSTMGAHSCPPLTSLDPLATVDLFAAGHVWRAEVSPCFALSVSLSRDGRPLVGKSTQASNTRGGPPAATMFLDELKALGVRL